MKRRALLATALATPFIARAQAAPRIVVIGGGFGGATAARFLRRGNPPPDIVLIEPNPIFTACPFSNEVIAGLRDIAAQRFGYEPSPPLACAWCRRPPPGSMPQAAPSPSRTARTLPMTGWCCAPGIDLAVRCAAGL